MRIAMAHNGLPGGNQACQCKAIGRCSAGDEKHIGIAFEESLNRGYCALRPAVVAVAGARARVGGDDGIQHLLRRTGFVVAGEFHA